MNKTDRSKAGLVSRQYIVPFALVTSLFFMWGFARAILDVLNKHFQDVLSISIGQSALIQGATYLAYFLMAIPAGMFITHFGYRRGVVAGLLLFGLGALMFIPAAGSLSFYMFLAALFVMGSGLAALETAANPYVTELGDRRTAASRLNLAQSFNGLGCILAPVIAGHMLLGNTDHGAVAVPYSVMGVVVLAVALVFTRVRLPEIGLGAVGKATGDDTTTGGSTLAVIGSLLSNPKFALGLLALFCYEVSEISINSFFINYATADGWLDARTAATVLSFCGLGLFMLARVAGSWVMSRIAAERVLTVCGVMTVLGSLAVVLDMGWLSRGGIFVCYAFEAIMFPTIFAITIKGLGSRATKMASALLMMTPLGGAVGTMLMGFTADVTGSMSTAFVVPFAGYCAVMLYAWMASTRRLA